MEYQDQVIAVKPATVVLNDKCNLSINSAEAANNNAQAVSAIALGALWQERKTWDVTTHRTSNQQLYRILAKCYAFYLAMGADKNAGKPYRDELRDFIKTHELRINKGTHGIAKVLKCVFYDDAQSVDRRRISTYSTVLQCALAQNKSAAELADFIERNGGVQEIRLSKASAKPMLDRAELGRKAVDQVAVMATFRSDAISQQIDCTDFDEPFVGILVARVTGEIEVRSVLKSKSAVNAALAAHYKAANDSSKDVKAA